MGALPLILAGQGLPPFPVPEATATLPNMGELLPFRPVPMEAEGERKEPIRLRGKNVQESAEGWTLVDGAVESKDLMLLADRMQYSTVTGQLEAQGHIRLEGPGVRLRCDRLKMDWVKRIGEAYVLELELPPTWLLRSDKVEFNTFQHWEFDKVELSPCPEQKPGWKAYVSKLTVDLDHYARLHNLWIWAFNLPTYYYLPYAIYPAKAERTSGVLPISMSFSGPTGASLAVPYYQVLGKSADATITPQYFTQQGILWNGDLRWNPEPTHQGELSGEYISQRTQDLHRYRLNAKELWQREDGWQFTADINRASDTLLDSDYGNGIARLGSNSYDSSTYLGKKFAWGNLNVTASQQQTYFLPSDPFYSSTFPASMQKDTLPSFQGTFYPIPLGSFYVDGGVRTGHLGYNLNLDPSTVTEPLSSTYSWNREDAFLRLAGRMGQWGPFRTDLQLGGRFTHYSSTLGTSFYATDNALSGSNLQPGTNANANPFIVNGPSADRMLASGRMQFSLPPVGRLFPDAHLFGYSGEVKHVLDPYFAVTGTSRSGVEGYLPHFDQVDSQPGVAGGAAGEDSLELGVKQHFLGRPGPGSIFLDLVRWKVSTKYYFRTILLPSGLFQKAWGSLDNDIDVEPNDKLHLSFRQSTDISSSASDNSLSAEYRAGDGTRFNLAFFSTGINRLLVRQRGIQLGGLQRLWSDQVRLEFSTNYDFTQHGFSTSQVALAYVQPCVSESLRFSHVAITASNSLSREDRLDLVVTLRNLGDLFQMGLF
ncbi:MAG: putative LPS assembly protein LptD [Holophaga sp.]|nr:putative LPS assembly protein LptD [Holophaga sp.]